MRVEELDFQLPGDLIAQRPAEPRDHCRLMYLPRAGATQHLIFRALPELLCPGDLLVFNDSKVIPARVFAHKPSGGRVELLFLEAADASSLPTPANGECWEALARPSHRLRPGGELVLPGGERLVLAARLGQGKWVVCGPENTPLLSLMEKYGSLPVPPYVRAQVVDPASYQTVYATHPGSAAAPTAGLHFTPRLMASLAARGVHSAFVTLHVGLDSFLPIREQLVEEHRIHRETYSVEPEALVALRKVRARGGRVVAVGTTSVRVLETLAGTGLLEKAPGTGASGSTDLFIFPGYRFRLVDVLITNFHLPRSTLLALVMAFAGKDRIKQAYEEAIRLRYRFFSFGDAMLIERTQ